MDKVRAMLMFLVSVVGVPAHLASGDSVQPRNTESVIESITPAPPAGVRIDIVGFDTFMRVRADGHAVEIPGYEGEPYLRIDADGTVQVNDGSQTSVLNGDRYGDVDLTNFVPSAEPVWRTIADNGVAMWHDHRSHWMSPKAPAPVDDTGKVQDFSIPIVIDDTKITVTGTMFLRDDASMWWWAWGVLAVVVMVVLSLSARRVFVWTSLLTSVVVGVIGLVELLGLPSGARITPVLALFGAGAMFVVALGLWLGRRRTAEARFVEMSLHAGAGATLLVASWMVVEQVQSAYVPGMTWGGTDFGWVARVIIPWMVGVGLVATIDGITRVVRGDAD